MKKDEEEDYCPNCFTRTIKKSRCASCHTLFPKTPGNLVSSTRRKEGKIIVPKVKEILPSHIAKNRRIK